MQNLKLVNPAVNNPAMDLQEGLYYNNILILPITRILPGAFCILLVMGFSQLATEPATLSCSQNHPTFLTVFLDVMSCCHVSCKHIQILVGLVDGGGDEKYQNTKHRRIKPRSLSQDHLNKKLNQSNYVLDILPRTLTFAQLSYSQMHI